MSLIILAKDEAMDAIEFATRFSPGEAAITGASYTLHQFTAVGASATLANGAGSATDLLIVDDVTLLTVGGYYQIGSTDPVRIDWINPVSNTAGLHEDRTWSDNAQVKPVTVSDATSEVSGVTLDDETGELDGTPDTLGSTASGTFPSGTLFVRATDDAGLSADTSPFDIQVDNPPVPPVFSGPINNEAFTIDDVVDLDWGQYFVGATSYSLDGDLPNGLSFNSSTAEVTGTVIELGGFGPLVVTAINSAGNTDSNEVTLTVSSGPMTGGGGLSFINDFSFSF